MISIDNVKTQVSSNIGYTNINFTNVNNGDGHNMILVVYIGGSTSNQYTVKFNGVTGTIRHFELNGNQFLGIASFENPTNGVGTLRFEGSGSGDIAYVAYALNGVDTKHTTDQDEKTIVNGSTTTTTSYESFLTNSKGGGAFFECFDIASFGLTISAGSGQTVDLDEGVNGYMFGHHLNRNAGRDSAKYTWTPSSSAGRNICGVYIQSASPYTDLQI